MLRLMIFSVGLALLLGASEAATIRVDPSSEQLYIVGPIVPGDYNRFVAAVRSASGDVFSVDIVSLGGDVDEAIAIGRLIHKLGFATNAPSAADYAPEARAMMCNTAGRIARSPCSCVSACFLIWAGGVARSGNDIHIHRIRFTDTSFGALPPTEASTRYQQALEHVHQYLLEMEIPESVWEKMVRMPSWATEQVDNQSLAYMTWPPSYAEWLNARCGFPNANPNWGQCTLDQQRAAARNALQRFRAGN